MKNKKLPIWAKTLVIGVPLVALVAFVAFSGEIFGGQGFIKKPQQLQLKTFTSECQTYGFYGIDNWYVVQLQDKKGNLSDFCKADDWVVTATSGASLKNIYSNPEKSPQEFKFLRKNGGGLNIRAKKGSFMTDDNFIIIEPAVTPTNSEYLGGELTSSLIDSAQFISNGGKTTMLFAKIMDDMDGNVQNLKSIKLNIKGTGTCQKAINCIENAYVNVDSSGSNLYNNFNGVVSASENSIQFENIVYKISDGEPAKLNFVLTLKDMPQALNEKTKLQLFLYPKDVKITDQNGLLLKLRPDNGAYVKGDEFYVTF